MKTFVISLTLIVIGAMIGRRMFSRPGVEFTGSREKNLEILRKVADMVNRDLPKRLDAETTLLRVDVTNSGVVNRYKISTLTYAEFSQVGIMGEAAPRLREETCANKSYRKAMDYGFTVSYFYVDRNNQPAGSVTFAQADCEKGLTTR
ncbi:MAG: hypothetical protein HY700_04690 [Gemmatimonadetes bacterium]|nr:hypothetical protein [Gemmatimonadota bacterium]